MKDKKIENLINAGLLALGWIVAKDPEHMNSTPGKILARALKDCGANSYYIEEILKSTPVITHPPDETI